MRQRFNLDNGVANLEVMSLGNRILKGREKLVLSGFGLSLLGLSYKVVTSRPLDRVHTRLTSGFGIREPDHLYPWVPWASLRICRDHNSTTYRAGKTLGFLYLK